jgi:hypothetical protein
VFGDEEKDVMTGLLLGRLLPVLVCRPSPDRKHMSPTIMTEMKLETNK